MPCSAPTSSEAQADGFLIIPRNARNIDRWIIRSSILNALQAVFPRLRGQLLDVGCGRMPYRSAILQNTEVTEYVGLEVENALQYDAEVEPDAKWDGRVMPFPEHAFDCAIVTEVFEHVGDLPLLLSEIYRVLRPGGVIFVTTPFVWPYHEVPHDMQRWTAFGVRHHLAAGGFADVEVASVGNWHSSLAQFLGLWVARAPMPGVVRRLVRFPVFLLQLLLMRYDGRTADAEGSMPRMLSGVAVKPVV